MKTKFKNFFSFSKLSIYLIIFVVIYTQLNLGFWKKKERVICWDVISYYAYLPVTFIYKDLSLDFMDDYKGDHEFVIWPSKAPNGKKLIKTTMGLSILYAPFFFIGHLVALNSHYDAGGYSEPYKLLILISSLFYLIMGLHFLRKILLLYFEERIAAIVILLTFFATNLHYYATTDASASHVYSFGLVSAFIWCTHKWHNKQSIANTLLVGLLAGLISIVRPSNSVIGIVFIFWGVANRNELKARLVLFYRNWFKLILLLIIGVSIWIPQFLYWKMQTGTYFYFTYGDGEGFFFSNPQIINGLFSFRKGWFIYTPVMFFAVAGIFLMRNKLKGLIVPITLFLIVNIYVIFSWWCWWYGGSFGQRSFIDSYALMAIPLGAFLTWFFYSKKIYLKRTIIIFATIILLHGIYQTTQFYYGAIHWDAMTYKAYVNSFGKIRPYQNMDKLIKSPDYELAKSGKEDYFLN